VSQQPVPSIFLLWLLNCICTAPISLYPTKTNHVTIRTERGACGLDWTKAACPTPFSLLGTTFVVSPHTHCGSIGRCRAVVTSWFQSGLAQTPLFESLALPETVLLGWKKNLYHIQGFFLHYLTSNVVFWLFFTFFLPYLDFYGDV